MGKFVNVREKLAGLANNPAYTRAVMAYEERLGPSRPSWAWIYRYLDGNKELDHRAQCSLGWRLIKPLLKLGLPRPDEYRELVEQAKDKARLVVRAGNSTQKRQLHKEFKPVDVARGLAKILDNFPPAQVQEFIKAAAEEGWIVKKPPSAGE